LTDPSLTWLHEIKYDGYHPSVAHGLQGGPSNPRGGPRKAD
jgi:hypothetical protein